MTVIHMDTEKVSALVQILNRSTKNLDDEMDALNGVRTRLQVHWIAEGSSKVVQKNIDRCIKELRSANLEMENMAHQLRNEVEQWLDADAFFSGSVSGGGGVSGQIGAVEMPTLTIGQLQQRMCGAKFGDDLDRCLLIWGNPPTNAEQLAFMIQSLPEDLPIVIMDIGGGEYLVLMRGTTSGTDEGSNWGSAIESMFTKSSYQNSVVSALQNANLPPGAKLHFAGHSQGGMIAQNLAVDPRVLQNYSVGSVSMFGSPDTMSRANRDVHYVSYEAPGDIVPHLDEIVTGVLVENGLAPLSYWFNDVSIRAEKHIITNKFDAFNPNPFVSHRVYDDPGVLTDHAVPFQGESWQGVSQSGTEISTFGAQVYKDLKEGADEVARRIKQTGRI